MVDHNESVMHLMNPVNVTRISIAGIVDRVFKLKVSYIMMVHLLNIVHISLRSSIWESLMA